MTTPGVRRAPPADNVKPPSAFKSHREQCYHLQDTCYERRASGNIRTLNYAIFNIYTCFDVTFSHYYTFHSSLHINDNKVRNSIIITAMV